MTGLCERCNITEMMEATYREGYVWVYHNSETGDWLYSICTSLDPEFWLASFDTEEEAIDWIATHNFRLGHPICK